MATNITWHSSLTHSTRSTLRNQKGLTIWLTGLSASGKSTIAVALEQHLLHLGLHAYRLDGDNIRFGLNKDLGFSPKDREENIRRIAEVSKLFADSASVAITSFISPYRRERDFARGLHGESNAGAGAGASDGAGGKGEGLGFVEVWVDCPLEVVEKRDPKGLYKKARLGEIPEFTGISAPYEEPLNPEVHLRSDLESVEDSVRKIVAYLEEHGYLKKNSTV